MLCSLLLGVGYDAYVVSGYAPRAITTLDQSATAFPTTAVEAKKEEAKQEQTKYKVRPMKSLESNFLKSQAAKREAEAAAALRGDDEGKEDTELIAAQAR